MGERGVSDNCGCVKKDLRVMEGDRNVVSVFACFLCACGSFISPVSSQNSTTINLEIGKAAVPPSGAAFQPETTRCNTDARLHLYSGAQTFICTGIARAYSRMSRM